MWKLRHYTAIAVGLAALHASVAQAIPISYQGTLQSYETSIDNANADSGPFADASGWRFWRFNAGFGQNVQIQVDRLIGALDPVFGVWFGTETDTDNYFGDMTSSSLFTTLVGFADDELPPNLAGPGGDSFLNFIAPGTGIYVIAVADHSATATTAGDLQYSISLAIPEPAAITLAGAAMGALVFGRRRNH
jgi:hypothetical protein